LSSNRQQARVASANIKRDGIHICIDVDGVLRSAQVQRKRGAFFVIIWAYAMTKRKNGTCYCKSYCVVCEVDLLTEDSIKHHNLRVACHGERAYTTFSTQWEKAIWQKTSRT
jgi:hypothetical protein